jgi:hypothetical protein
MKVSRFVRRSNELWTNQRLRHHWARFQQTAEAPL